MKTSELSVGDWVKVLNYYWDGSPYIGQVNGIIKRHGTYYLQFGDAFSAEIERCEPIPITPEILAKNGFEPICDGESVFGYTAIGNGENEYDSVLIDFTHPRLSRIYSLKERREYNGSIAYVHQLQHAFRLFGIEKDIEL